MKRKENFATVLGQIEEIANTSSTNDKVELLKEYIDQPLFRKVCVYA